MKGCFHSCMQPRSVYFCAIPPSSPVQNELYLTTPDFSLFVLKLPLPKRKAEVKFHHSFLNFRSQNEKRKLKFHYLFWNFRSQIETRKPIVRNKLSLATAHFFTNRFGTSVPNRKAEVCIHCLFWNFPPRS